MQTKALIRDIYSLKEASILGYTAREPDLKCCFDYKGGNTNIYGGEGN